MDKYKFRCQTLDTKELKHGQCIGKHKPGTAALLCVCHVGVPPTLSLLSKSYTYLDKNGFAKAKALRGAAEIPSGPETAGLAHALWW